MQGWPDQSGLLSGIEDFSFLTEDFDIPSTGIGMHPPQDRPDLETRSCSPDLTCLSALLSALTRLEHCVHTNACSSPDELLSAAQSGLSACNESRNCRNCFSSTLLILCREILELIGTCYEQILAGTLTSVPKVSLSLGGVEFDDISSRGIMSAIVGIERHKGAAICAGLRKLAKPIAEHDADIAWGGDQLHSLLALTGNRLDGAHTIF